MRFFTYFKAVVVKSIIRDIFRVACFYHSCSSLDLGQMELKLGYEGLLDEAAQHLKVFDLGLNIKHEVDAVASFPSEPFFTHSILAGPLNDADKRQASCAKVSSLIQMIRSHRMYFTIWFFEVVKGFVN